MIQRLSQRVSGLFRSVVAIHATSGGQAGERWRLSGDFPAGGRSR